jgi:hypothetical protein
MTDARTSRDLTDNQILRKDAARQAERIAKDLEDLAARIRCTAQQFDDESRMASKVAADIVSDYTQGGGNIGSMLWMMINELSRTK